MSQTRRSDLADYVVRQSVPRKTARERQLQIYNDSLKLSRAMTSPNFTRVGRDDLQRMARMYDDLFFDGRLLPLAQKEGLSFGWSSRMTKNAGKTVTHYPAGYRRGDRRRFEIILSSSLLFQTFSDVNRPVEVTGIMCRNRLQAMQRVLEHELVHLVEMLVWDDSSCSKTPFQQIANRFFGHTQHQHDLITQRERAARKFKIGVGTHVRFDFEGQALQGVVNRITRRATVLVPDRRGAMFDDGRRYRKYYVPLEHLRRAAREAEGT
ncbi:SprT family zinc-dependent metalloprotease [Roseimaritima sediminicola]|uniref:hypothetical protein n=1 Tax=Roseimaritima sediminicola TaxID=2662066 RepID=UPI0012982576|nr:hypothetical protein [Roseimaritima sediminicola]